MEWLVHEGHIRSESCVAAVLDTFVAQVVRRQWMPAASAAFRASSCAQATRVDQRLDASTTAEAEREAGQAMGARLLDLAAATLPAPRVEGFREAVAARQTPGQFAVGFGLVARDCTVPEADMLAALGYSAANSLIQSVVRLGVIGAEAAVRLGSHLASVLANAAGDVAGARRQRIGAFAPMLEIASMLQPTLRFRMFAS